MFFDRFPQFAETSSTASRPARLNIRHHGMFESNQAIFTDAKVLDLASHDGRWSMAALDAGASHVTGVEGRAELVSEAESTFSMYGVDSSRYRFINDDMFDVLHDPVGNGIDVDVVMCLGFIYHTLRYQDLFAGIRALKPKYFLIDTAVIKHDKAMVLLHSEDSSKESAGLGPHLPGGRAVSHRQAFGECAPTHVGRAWVHRDQAIRLGRVLGREPSEERRPWGPTATVSESPGCVSSESSRCSA